MISNFRPVPNVVCSLLGNSPASEFYMPTFRNTLSVPSSYAGRYEEILYTYPPLKMEQSVPKRWHIKFRRRGITKNKAHNRILSVFEHTVIYHACILSILSTHLFIMTGYHQC